MSNYKTKKEIFSELRSQIYQLDTFEVGVKLSSLNNIKIIDQIKALKVIELDNIESFVFYKNYDHYLMFKFNDEYYFCDFDLFPGIGEQCLIKLVDYNRYLRKDKINKINEN